jgi:hypothetical protein
MKKPFFQVLSIIMVVGVLGAVSPAWSDWNPGDPYKWLQPPDLTPNGVDVHRGLGFLLADDFQCTGSGPITDIHLWGSYLNDQGPQELTFVLGIWTNIPATPTAPSTPGSLIKAWTFYPGQYQSRIYSTVTSEYFWNPFTGAVGTDTQVWQFNFFIDPEYAFVQTLGQIYWLSVGASVGPDESYFGWKTTDPQNHFGDDAVWGYGVWEPLTYFPGHPYAGESMDLAFVITPIPATLPLLGTGLLGLAALAYRRRRQ